MAQAREFDNTAFTQKGLSSAQKATKFVEANLTDTTGF
jgi:hypothetical protein